MMRKQRISGGSTQLYEVVLLQSEYERLTACKEKLIHLTEIVERIHYITAGNIYVFTDVEGEVLAEISELEWYRRAFAVIHNMAAPAVNDE